MKEESRITNENLELSMEEIEAVAAGAHIITIEQFEANKIMIDFMKLQIQRKKETFNKIDIGIMCWGKKSTDVISLTGWIDRYNPYILVRYEISAFESEEEAIEKGKSRLKELRRNQRAKFIQTFKRQEEPYQQVKYIVMVHRNNNNPDDLIIIANPSQFNIFRFRQLCENKKDAEKILHDLFIEELTNELYQ